MIPYCILAIEDEDNRNFMARIFVEYYRLMYREINSIVHDPWAADDILQDTLERLIKKVDELQIKSKRDMINYIITACQNQAKNYIRKNSKYVGLTLEEVMDLPNPDEGQEEMELRIIHAEDKERMPKVWSELDERSRYLLESYYILGKSAYEIAADLDIKPESVRMALTRARKTAYKLLDS